MSHSRVGVMSLAKEKKSIWTKLDPFTYVDEWVMPRVNPWNNEILSWIIYIIFSFIFAYALYTAFGLILQTASPLVIVVSGSMLPTMARGDVVVLHGVTGPDLHVPEVILDGVDVEHSSLGDLATITPTGLGDWDITFNNGQTIHVPKKGTSDIVVYYSSHKNLEIIHRAVVKIKSDGKYFVLTKGDNNPSLDQDCGDVSDIFFPQGSGVQTITDKSCPSPYPVSLSDVKGKALFWIPYVGFIKLLLVDGFSGQ